MKPPGKQGPVREDSALDPPAFCDGRVMGKLPVEMVM
jgi:hypothetical protein